MGEAGAGLPRSVRGQANVPAGAHAKDVVNAREIY